MKASEAGLLSFLKKANQFVIPIYQRNYSWTEAECRQLWSDIVRAGADENVPSHFIGSIVYIDKGFAVHWTPLLVIDGQQRLTTAALLIAALAEALDALPEDEREVADGFSPNKLRNYYLVNPEETAEKYFKLLLSQTDRSTLCAVVSGKPLPPEPQTSTRIVENLGHFRGWLAAPSTDLAAVCRGLAKLTVVDIALSRDHDNPQLIFESMNSTGRELSQADLIRNYVLMGQEPKTQTDLYERYWHPMEQVFGQRAYGEQFDAFVRHFLTVRTGTIPNIREVYAAFKQYVASKPVAEAGTDALLADLLRTARHYSAMPRSYSARASSSRPSSRRAVATLPRVSSRKGWLSPCWATCSARLRSKTARLSASSPRSRCSTARLFSAAPRSGWRPPAAVSYNTASSRYSARASR